MIEKGSFVVVRAYGAGVHVGTLVAHEGRTVERTVELSDARRVWRWRGANTLHELSLYGASEEYTRISEPVASIVLCDAIEIIVASHEAAENLRRSRWAP